MWRTLEILLQNAWGGCQFLCKLLEVQAFEHLKSKLTKEEVKVATGDWEKGNKEAGGMVQGPMEKKGAYPST